MSTGIETAVARPADEAAMFANPAQWQAFVKRILVLEERVKKLEEQLSPGHLPNTNNFL